MLCLIQFDNFFRIFEEWSAYKLGRSTYQPRIKELIISLWIWSFTTSPLYPLSSLNKTSKTSLLQHQWKNVCDFLICWHCPIAEPIKTLMRSKRRGRKQILPGSCTCTCCCCDWSCCCCCCCCCWFWPEVSYRKDMLRSLFSTRVEHSRLI